MEPDTTEEALDNAIIEWVIGWIEERDPNFFLEDGSETDG